MTQAEAINLAEANGFEQVLHWGSDNIVFTNANKDFLRIPLTMYGIKDNEAHVKAGYGWVHLDKKLGIIRYAT